MNKLTETKWYSISEASELTGVNPVTLRAWQRRYGLLTPKRTPKGHRLYSDEDITLITNILNWLGRGVSIGKVKPLLMDQVEDYNDEAQPLDITNDIISAIQAGNSRKLEKLLHEALKLYPYELIQKQLLPDVTKVIEQPNNPLIFIQKSLWSSVLTLCFVSIISKINTNKKPSCLLLSFDETTDHRIWQQALAQCYLGDNVTVMAAIAGRLTGLAAMIHERHIHRVIIVGETKLSRQQLLDIEHLQQQCEIDIHYIGSINTIHN